MTIWALIAIIAGLGGVGGIVNCAVAGEFVLPRFDPTNRAWRPGWIGNVVIGSIAAVVVGGMYGPLSQVVVNAVGAQTLPPLTVAQLFGAVVVGLGGGNILTQLAQRQAERLAKDNLASTLASLTQTPPQPAAPPASAAPGTSSTGKGGERKG